MNYTIFIIILLKKQKKFFKELFSLKNKKKVQKNELKNLIFYNKIFKSYNKFLNN
jgi:hypothetical protein